MSRELNSAERMVISCEGSGCSISAVAMLIPVPADPSDDEYLYDIKFEDGHQLAERLRIVGWNLSDGFDHCPHCATRSEVARQIRIHIDTYHQNRRNRGDFGA